MSIRDELRKIVYELGASQASYTKEEAIAELRRRRPDVILKESRKLEDIALKRLLCDVEARMNKGFDPNQYDLFDGLSGLPLSVPITHEGGIRSRALLLKLDLEALQKQAERTAELRKSRDQKSALELLWEELSPFSGSEGISVEEALKRLRAA